MVCRSVNEAVQKRFIKPVIIAGGFGGGLNAISDASRNRYAIAKAVVPIGAYRSIDFALRAVQRLGVGEAHVAIWHLGQTIEQVVRPSIRINYFTERVQDPLDTAGPVFSIVREQGWDSGKENIVVVQSADIVHNIPLERVISQHLETRAAVTIVVNPVPWDEMPRFGSVRLEGMPQRNDFKTEIEFEDAVGAWLVHQESARAKIVEFREKCLRNTPDPAQACLSNLNNSSIYVFSSYLLRNLMALMTKKGKDEPLFPDLYKPGGPSPFSDWGRHIFKWLTGRSSRQFPVYAYVLPEYYAKETGERSYWKDIGMGEDLRQANMDVLDGKVKDGLEDYIRETWGWRGKNVFIDPTARIQQSLISDNCVIGPRVRLDHAIIGENTTVEAGVHIYRSVIFPKPYERSERNLIAAGSRLVECLFLGGATFRRSLFERKMVYSPLGGCAVDSLFKKTEIF